jgi:hypothetical protein
MATLERFAYGPEATLGRLILDGALFYTIERPWLDNTPFKSCIPEGVYRVEPYSSPKYPDVWELKEVPERTHILIHAANHAKDVQGCIGPGMGLAPGAWWVTHSQNAMTVLRSKLPQEFEINVTHYIPQYP